MTICVGGINIGSSSSSLEDRFHERSHAVDAQVFDILISLVA